MITDNNFAQYNFAAVLWNFYSFFFTEMGNMEQPTARLQKLELCKINLNMQISQLMVLLPLTPSDFWYR